MRPEEIRKLLGGYATGTLTPEEQQALFAAAMEDQELFNALGREQALRDVLRDPAARGELLSALDRPSSGFAAFWQWLRQPVVAGVVTACFLGFIGVTVWRGTHPVADRVVVAELRQQDLRDQAPHSALPAPQPVPQPAPAARSAGSKAAGQQGASENKARAFAPSAGIPAGSGGGGARRPEFSKAAENAAPANPMVKKEVAPMAPPPPPTVATAPAAPPAVPPQSKADAVTAGNITLQAQMQRVQQTVDARSMFYEQPPAVNGFAGSAGSTPQRAAASALASTGNVPAPRLGLRVSVMRGDQEVDPATVLNAGESVRVKLIPNAEGFLSVTEGTRVIASGAAHRMQEFETPPIANTNAGARQLVITFSRTPVSGGLAGADSAARPNLVESSADQGRATYVVSNAPLDGNQVVVPVTLTYR